MARHDLLADAPCTVLSSAAQSGSRSAGCGRTSTNSSIEERPGEYPRKGVFHVSDPCPVEPQKTRLITRLPMWGFEMAFQLHGSVKVPKVIRSYIEAASNIRRIDGTEPGNVFRGERAGVAVYARGISLATLGVLFCPCAILVDTSNHQSAAWFKRKPSCKTAAGSSVSSSTALQMATGQRAPDILNHATIAIDDFRKSYSSLSYLRRFDPTHIKIDQSFIKDMLDDLGYMTIVASTINLAHDLGMTVVAEGRRDPALVGQVAWFGCDMVQGFLLSKPLPAWDVEKHFLSVSANAGVG